jgi:nucleoid-associated protein YgaU
VARGDCLWRIAGAALPGTPSDARVAGAVQAWWAANRAVIGADPDLLLPGQVLHAPAAPTGGDR